jgi:hypothetical protein
MARWRIAPAAAAPLLLPLLVVVLVLLVEAAAAQETQQPRSSMEHLQHAQCTQRKQQHSCIEQNVQELQSQMADLLAGP